MFSRVIICYALIILTLGMAVKCSAQANIGFENGTFDNWEFANGYIQTSGRFSIGQSIAVPGSFTILKKDESGIKDYYGNFSIFAPNSSNYCVKLGNETYGNTVQQMSYTLTVPATGSNNIIFDYAVVLQNPGHESYQQPRFTVKVYNVTDGKYLDCPAFDFVSSSSLPGFKYNNDGVFYKDWSSASINLTGLNNKTVRLEFTVNHCPFGQHFGYAYIDINESLTTPVQGNNYCANQSAITLSGPPGFATYSWASAETATALGTGQFLTLPLPIDKNKLSLTVEPFDGWGCPTTFYFDVNKIDDEIKFVTKPAIVGCPGSTIDLTQPSVTAGSNANLTYEYLNESFDPLTLPASVSKPGLYYIRAKNFAGCSNILPIQISFESPSLVINDPAAVTYPATINLAKTFTPQPGVSYSYYSDNSATKPIPNYNAVQNSGLYYIKAETAYGCVNIQPVNVTVLAPDANLTAMPNTFTPNNDGINDYFRVPNSQYITLNYFRIYNRYGTPIFNTTKATGFWDGTVNGKPAPAGVYYWVFNGYDSYNRKITEKASYITLVR